MKILITGVCGFNPSQEITRLLTKAIYQTKVKKTLTKIFPGLNSPVYRAIIETIKLNLGLLVLTFTSSLVSAVLETATLGVIFLALSVLQGSELPKLPTILTSTLPWLAEKWKAENQEIFLGMIAVAVLLQLLRSLMIYIKYTSSGDLSVETNVQMTQKVFTRIMSFTFPCSSRYKIGDLTSYVGEAGSAVNAQVQQYVSLLSGMMMFLGYTTTLLLISIPLSATALIMLMLLGWVQRWLIPRIQSNAYKLSYAQVELSKDMVENIQALRLVHTFGYHFSVATKISSLQGRISALLKHQTRLLSVTEPLNSALTIFVVAFLLIASSFFLRTGNSGTLPALATFILALNRLAMQVQGLAGTINGFAANSARIHRLNAILDDQTHEFSRVGGEMFEGLKSAITFDHVSLKYEGTSLPALSDICFKLPRNRVVALIGSSGAGKSSVADLLIGLYAPTTGEILVDGLDLQSYGWESWRSKLGVVSQDTFIFNQSILENIRYGMPNATDEQVLEAARVAQADQFIQLLPRGYETVVGERGYRLSGGQRQRVALARAILKQPEILILDEATSALDSESERLVQQALGQFQAQRTVLVIAHRLSTIVNADEILVMEQGCIVERGTHQELLELGAKYANYWQMQSIQV